MPVVGVLGLGAMGLPMARRLLEHGPVAAFDLDPARVAAVAEAGATTARSCAEVATLADVVVVMVSDAAQLDVAVFGADGAATAMAKGDCLIIMSTVGPNTATAVADRLRSQDIAVLDAPVSGGTERAGRGELVVMAGGSDVVFQRCREILDCLGDTVVQVGKEVGDGQTVKLVNQLLCGVHIAAAAEALDYAERLGLDPVAVWDVVRHGAAGSFMFNDRGARMLDHRYEPVHSALSIFVKDMGLVIDEAQRAGVRLDLAENAAALFSEAARAGWGNVDDASVVEVLRNRPRE